MLTFGPLHLGTMLCFSLYLLQVIFGAVCRSVLGFIVKRFVLNLPFGRILLLFQELALERAVLMAVTALKLAMTKPEV